MEVSATFRQTKQVNQYEPAVAEVTVTHTLEAGATAEAAAAAAAAMMRIAKSQVFLELDLPFEQDPTTQVIKQTFPSATVVHSQPVPAAQPAPAPAADPFAAVAQPVAQQPALAAVPVADPTDLWAQLAADPSQWYDNRLNKRNPKAPDFKHTTLPDPQNPQYKMSLWLRDCPPGMALPAAGFAG